MNSECDVLVIGGGMAGSCMALQLKSRMPQLSVTLVEKKKKFDYWVGESTVEMWDDYMTRVLGLGPYLEKHTMQKHGLRFFSTTKKNLSNLSKCLKWAAPNIMLFQPAR